MSASFDDVKYGFAISGCSPQFSKDDPNGIKIAAPPAIALSASGADGGPPRLPLCITMRFDGLYLSKFDQVFKALKVVVAGDDPGQTLSGGIWRDRHYLPKGPSKIPPDELKQRLFTEHYTVNLLEFFPLRVGSYKVFALLEQHKSNVVTVAIKEE